MATKGYTPALGFDWLTIWYDLAVKLTMPEQRFRNELIDHLDPNEGEYILEFGFGTGANLILASKQSPKSKLAGLDIDPKVRELAIRKLMRQQIFVDLELYDGGTFPFENNSFQKVYSCLVFHHLDANAKAHCLKEMYRILKPGGKIVIGDWGKAKSKPMRWAFYIVQLLDGFKTTSDNVNGKLPSYIEGAGFKMVSETGYINTTIGSFSYYEGFK